MPIGILAKTNCKVCTQLRTSLSGILAAAVVALAAAGAAQAGDRKEIALAQCHLDLAKAYGRSGPGDVSKDANFVIDCMSVAGFTADLKTLGRVCWTAWAMRDNPGCYRQAQRN